MKKIVLLLIPIVIVVLLWNQLSSSDADSSIRDAHSSKVASYEQAKKSAEAAAAAKAAKLRARIRPIDCADAPDAAVLNDELPEILQGIFSIDCYQSGHRLQSLKGEAWLLRIVAQGPVILPVFYVIKAQVVDDLAEEDYTVSHNVHFTAVEHKVLGRDEGLAVFANLPDSVVLPNAETLPVETFMEIKAINQDKVEIRLYVALLSQPAQGIDRRFFRAFGFGCKPDCDYDSIFKIMQFDEIATPSTIPPDELKTGEQK